MKNKPIFFKYLKWYFYLMLAGALLFAVLFTNDVIDRQMNTYFVQKPHAIIEYNRIENRLFEIEDLKDVPFEAGEKVWLQHEEIIGDTRYGYVKTYTFSRTRRWGYIPMTDLKKAP